MAVHLHVHIEAAHPQLLLSRGNNAEAASKCTSHCNIKLCNILARSSGIIAPVVRGDVCGGNRLGRDAIKDQLSRVLAKAAPNVLHTGAKQISQIFNHNIARSSCSLQFQLVASLMHCNEGMRKPSHQQLQARQEDQFCAEAMALKCSVRSYQEDGVWCSFHGIKRLGIKVMPSDPRVQKHQSLDACIHPELQKTHTVTSHDCIDSPVLNYLDIT